MPAPPRWSEYLPVSTLTPALKNAKGHDAAAMGASVREFGFVEPVVLDERTSRIVSGHGRVEWLAQQEATGADPPEGVTLDADGRWCWLVTRGWHSRDDLHAHAAGVALNRVGEKGGWRTDALADLLDGMRETPALIEASGFTIGELDEMVAGLSTPDFQPESLDGQPRLDVRNPTVCPKCGHHFHRT
jgi:hypothetical protein